MRTITLEEHVATPAYRGAIAKLPKHNLPNSGGRAMDTVLSKLSEYGDERIADMDTAGIDLQVLSLSGILMDALDSATATAVARDTNDALADAVRAHPTRFAAFASLGLREPEKAASEFKRCVTELGFVGAMVNGTTAGRFLDDPRFTPVFQVAQELNVPIYLHPAPPPKVVVDAYYSDLPNGYGEMLSIAGWGWHVETGLHALRLMAAGVFDRFPRLQIIIGHMGENLPFSIARADMVLSNSPKPMPRSATEYFRSNFHITTSGYFTLPPFLCAMMVLGVDRILFSVDYPFAANQKGKAFLDSLPISTQDMEKISHGNAERLLKL